MARTRHNRRDYGSSSQETQPPSSQETQVPETHPNVYNPNTIDDVTDSQPLPRVREENRLTIVDGRLEDHHVVSAMFTKIVKKSPCSQSKWSLIPKSTKDLWFEAWKAYFIIDASINIEDVRTFWEKHCRGRFSDYMSRIRTGRPKHLDWLDPEDVARFRAEMEDPEFRRISEKNRRNRLVNPALHTGGSICHSVHAARLEKKLGRPPTMSEIHSYLHTKGHDGHTFVDERARIVSERVGEILAERFPTTESQPTLEDDRTAYLEAAGGVRADGSVYCTGDLGRVVYVNEVRSSRYRRIDEETAQLRTANTTLQHRVAELETVVENQSTITRELVDEVRQMRDFISQMQRTPSFLYEPRETNDDTVE